MSLPDSATGICASGEKIYSFSSRSSLNFFREFPSLILSTRSLKSLRISRPSFVRASTLVAAALGALGLLVANVAATSQALPPNSTAETRSVAWSSVAEEQWFGEGPLGGQANGDVDLPTLPESAVTGVRSSAADFAFPLPEKPNDVLSSINLGASEEVPYGANPPAPCPVDNQTGTGRQDSRPALSLLVLLFLFALGLPSIHFLRVSSGQEKTGGGRFQPRDQQQKEDEKEQSTPSPSESQEDEQKLHEIHEKEPLTVGVHQLDELARLRALAAHLAKTVGTEESLSALEDFEKTVENCKLVQQQILQGSMDSDPSYSIVLADAVSDGLNALSELYEQAREHGISVAQTTRSIKCPPVFSKQELHTLAGCISSSTTGLMDFYFADFGSSFQLLLRTVETVQKRLESLRGVEGVNDWHVVAAVAAGVEFIKQAHESAEIQAKSFDIVKRSADAMILLHYLRQQTSIQRKFREDIAEYRVLCNLEKWRNLSAPQQDTTFPMTVAEVEKQLDEAERLLEKHQQEIDNMEKEDNIFSAQSAKMQAEMLASEVKNVLEAVSIHTDSLPGIGTAGDDPEVRQLMQQLAARAKQAAFRAAKRVEIIQREMKVRMPLGSDDGPKPVSPFAREALKIEFRKVAGNVQNAAQQAASAAAKVAKDEVSSAAALSELVATARAAALLAETHSAEAELLGLEMQLLDSMELDMRLSLQWARRAAAAVGVEAQVKESPKHWRLSLSAERTKKFQSLLGQVNDAKKNAHFRSRLEDLAVAAGVMREASLGLTSIVQGQDGTNLNPKFWV